MAKSRVKVTINPNLRQQIEAQTAPIMEAFQKKANELIEAHKGGSVDDLHQALIKAAKEVGLKPNVASLRKLAEKHIS